MKYNFEKTLNKEAKKVYNKKKKEITKTEGRNLNTFLVLVFSVLIIIITSSSMKNSTVNNIDKKNLLNLSSQKFNAKVENVVDGDTIYVIFNNGILNDGKKYKIRLIGIDTPESKHLNKTKNTKEGIIAYEYTKKMLEGKDVIVEFDIAQTDKYGRILAYIWLNNELYNKHLLDVGYAKIMTIQPNSKYVEELKNAQKKAIKNEVGFWKTKNQK